MYCSYCFSSVQSLSHVRLFSTPWIAARQASLSITNSRSSLRLTSIESVMPSSHLILCRPLLLLPSIFPSIRVFSNELVLLIRWPKYWSFSFNISPSNDYSGHYMWNKQKKTLKVERRHFSLGRTAGSVEQHDGEFSGFSFCLKYSMDIELKQPIIQKCQWRQTNKVPALSENQEKSSRAKQKTCRQ